MDQIPQILVAVLAVVLVLALVVRFVRGMPGRVRKARRPESRSIRVVGVGGGGSNAVDRMVEANMSGVDFVACNTDAQALRQSLATTKLRIGDAITHGLGSGGDPAVGRRAAEDDARRIGKTLAGADLVFVSAGLGGGTGSGAAPVISAKAREHGALTIAVVTKPFAFEGAKRRRVADEAADELRSQVDALITIPNDRIAGVMPAEASMIEAFRAVDAILADAVQGVIELLTSPGLVNVDFADVRAVMQDDGPAALIGLGRGSGLRDERQRGAR